MTTTELPRTNFGERAVQRHFKEFYSTLMSVMGRPRDEAAERDAMQAGLTYLPYCGVSLLVVAQAFKEVDVATLESWREDPNLPDRKLVRNVLDIMYGSLTKMRTSLPLT